MKRRSWVGVIVCLFFSFSAPAKTLTGYAPPAPQAGMSFDDKIERIIESKNDFHILFLHHPAFYTFPKSPANDRTVRMTLDQLLMDKILLNVEFDGVTGRISRIVSPDTRSSPRR